MSFPTQNQNTSSPFHYHFHPMMNLRSRNLNHYNDLCLSAKRFKDNGVKWTAITVQLTLKYCLAFMHSEMRCTYRSCNLKGVQSSFLHLEQILALILYNLGYPEVMLSLEMISLSENHKVTERVQLSPELKKTKMRFTLRLLPLNNVSNSEWYCLRLLKKC